MCTYIPSHIVPVKPLSLSRVLNTFHVQPVVSVTWRLHLKYIEVYRNLNHLYKTFTHFLFKMIFFHDPTATHLYIYISILSRISTYPITPHGSNHKALICMDVLRHCCKPTGFMYGLNMPLNILNFRMVSPAHWLHANLLLCQVIAYIQGPLCVWAQPMRDDVTL